jgi:hypothetical protein
MSEIFYLCSNDPYNYNKVKYSTQFIANGDIYYRIRNFSTFGSCSVLNANDFITLKIGGEEFTLSLFPHGPFTHDTLAEYMSGIWGFVVEINDRGLIELYLPSLSTGGAEWQIIDMSHRAKLCFGFYHTTLPVGSIGRKIISPSVPYFNYSNVLYLVSDVGKLVGTNLIFDERRQIAYKSIEFMRLELPVICDKKGEWIKIYENKFTQLEFTLCDFMMEPIIIHAPIHITIEVKITPYPNVPAMLPKSQTSLKCDGPPITSKPEDTES